MSDSPYRGMPAGPTPSLPQGPAPSNGPSRAPVIIAIVVALLALALAAASWFRPTHDETPATPQYSEQQVADAKKNLCDAYNTMLRGIKGAGALSSEDPNQKFMLALNTRLAFNTSADYLLSQANLNIAAPPRLLVEARTLAASYQKMVLAQIAEAPGGDLDSIYGELDLHESAIVEACK